MFLFVTSVMMNDIGLKSLFNIPLQYSLLVSLLIDFIYPNDIFLLKKLFQHAIRYKTEFENLLFIADGPIRLLILIIQFSKLSSRVVFKCQKLLYKYLKLYGCEKNAVVRNFRYEKFYCMQCSRGIVNTPVVTRIWLWKMSLARSSTLV